MVCHWSLSDNKSPQVFRTLLSILANLNNAVVLMVFICPFGIIPIAPIIFGITVTFMFHSFFSSLARSRYSSVFSLSFNFTLWSAGTAKSAIWQVLCFCWLSLSLVVWPIFSDLFLSQNPRELWASHSPGQRLILQVVHRPLVLIVKFKFLAQFSVDHFPHPVVSNLRLFCIFCCIH